MPIKRTSTNKKKKCTQYERTSTYPLEKLGELMDILETGEFIPFSERLPSLYPKSISELLISKLEALSIIYENSTCDKSRLYKKILKDFDKLRNSYFFDESYTYGPYEILMISSLLFDKYKPKEDTCILSSIFSIEKNELEAILECIFNKYNINGKQRVSYKKELLSSCVPLIKEPTTNPQKL